MDQIFSKARVRYVVPIVMLGYSLPYVFGGDLMQIDWETIDTKIASIDILLLDYVAHALIITLLCLIWCSRRKGVSVLGQHLDKDVAKTLLLLGIPMVGVSVFLFYLLFYPLSYVAPEFVLSWVVEFPEILVPFDRHNSLWINLGNALLIVLIVPIVEEIVFRGFLLGRLKEKYGLVVAIVVSSTLFAIGHGDVLGAFVFAVVMCVIRLRFNSLIAPILVHIGNNALVLILSAIDLFVLGTQYDYTLEEFRSYWWMAPIGAVIGIPWLVSYYRRDLSTVRLRQGN